MWQIWLIISGFCFVIEIATIGFFIFWFGIGALLAMVVSIFAPGNIWLQCSVFLISSCIFLLFTKPLINKFTKKEKKIETNAYSIIGKRAIVVQDINPTFCVGQIKIGNEVWSAKTIDNTKIDKTSEVRIVKIDGVKAVVEKIKVDSTIN